MAQELVAAVCLGSFGLLAVAVVVSGIAATNRRRRRREAFEARAAELGWVRARTADIPDDMAALATWRPPSTVMRREAMWLVWQHWTTTQRVNGHMYAQPHDRTRFMLPVPGPALPDVTVSHRAFSLFGPRGVGTGDAAFDLTFTVNPRDSAAAAALIGSGLRTAMLANRLPVFAVHNNVVSIDYGGAPSAPALDQCPAQLTEIAGYLRL